MTSPTDPTDPTSPTDAYATRLARYLQNPQQLRASPEAFRDALLIDVAGTPRPLVEVMDPWQAADFRALDKGWQRVCGQDVAGGYSRGYQEKGRGSSKTTDTAIMATFALFASGRKIHGFVAAVSKDQARLQQQAIDTLLRLNPWLGQLFEVQTNKVINTKTGSELVILSTDAPSAYGLLGDFFICEELTNWPSEEYWAAIFSAVPKRKNAMLAIISNAGYDAGSGWCWKIREMARTSEKWYFHSLDSPPSWISKKHLEEQRRGLPRLAYERLWLNRWTSRSGDALAESEISRAIKPELGPLTEPQRGWCYVSGIDLGVVRDASVVVTLGIDVGYREEQPASRVHRPKPSGVLAAMIDLGLAEEQTDLDTAPPDFVDFGGTGRMRLVSVDLWQSQGRGQKIRQRPIFERLISIDKRFGLSLVLADSFQAENLIEQLRDEGVAAEARQVTSVVHQAMASAILSAFGEGTIDLFQHEAMTADLRALRVVAKSYGVRLESPRVNSGGAGTGHGDCVSALGMAMLAAKRIAGSGRGGRISGKLLVWPE